MASGLSWRVIAACVLLLTGLAIGGLPSAQTSRPLVYVVPIDGVIDLGLAPFLSRTMRDAERAGAAAALLDINTFGGRVDAAVVMRDALLQAPVRTIAFVNPRAISAGALLALATETIVMTSGGTIGAAMPVLGGGGAPQAADETSVSYLRKEFAATAERRGRPAAFAEAMVDVDVEIPGVVGKGKLLTLTMSEAMRHHVGSSERTHCRPHSRRSAWAPMTTEAVAPAPTRVKPSPATRATIPAMPATPKPGITNTSAPIRSVPAATSSSSSHPASWTIQCPQNSTANDSRPMSWPPSWVHVHNDACNSSPMMIGWLNIGCSVSVSSATQAIVASRRHAP